MSEATAISEQGTLIIKGKPTKRELIRGSDSVITLEQEIKGNDIGGVFHELQQPQTFLHMYALLPEEKILINNEQMAVIPRIASLTGALKELCDYGRNKKDPKSLDHTKEAIQLVREAIDSDRPGSLAEIRRKSAGVITKSTSRSPQTNLLFADFALNSPEGKKEMIEEICRIRQKRLGLNGDDIALLKNNLGKETVFRMFTDEIIFYSREIEKIMDEVSISEEPEELTADSSSPFFLWQRALFNARKIRTLAQTFQILIEGNISDLPQEEIEVRDLIKSVLFPYEGRDYLGFGVPRFEISDSDKHLPVTTNSVALGIILENFIKNALRYSSDVLNKYPIGILIKEANGGIEISVDDHGIGLTDKELTKANAFVAQQRAKTAESHEPKGMGLGLYIGKRFADVLGMKMWLRSPGPRRGTTSSVFVPFSTMNNPLTA